MYLLQKNLLIPLLTLGLLFTASLINFDLSSQEFYLRRISDAMHVPLFIVVSFILSSWIVRWMGPKRGFSVSLAFCFCLGAGLELIQPYFERVASINDLLFNVLGTSIGVGLLVFKDFQNSTRALVVLSFLFGLTLSVSLMPVNFAWRYYQYKERQFPVLGEFSPGDFFYWRPYGAEKKPSKTIAGGAFKLKTKQGVYSGIAYDALSQDWSSKEKLILEINNIEAKALSLGVRIDDPESNAQFDSRFNTKIKLWPGRGRYEIYLSEVKKAGIDLENITFMYLFVGPEEGGPTLWLERAELA